MKKFNKILLAIIIISFVLKLGVLLASDYNNTHGDESGFVIPAKGEVADPFLRSQLYINYLKTHINIFGENLFWTRLCQIIVSSLSIFIMFLLTRKFFDENTSLIASGIFAFYPTLIGYSTLILTETLFVFFLLLFFYFILEYKEKTSNKTIFFAGIFGALGALTRGILLPFLFITIIWIIYEKKISKKVMINLSVFVVGILLILVPQAIANHEVTGKYFVSETTRGSNLWLGNNEFRSFNLDYKEVTEEPDWFVNRISSLEDRNNYAYELCRTDDPFEDNKCNTENALSYILANPGRFIKRIPVKLYDLFRPTSYIVRYIKIDYYGKLNNFLENTIIFLINASYLAAMLLFFYGIKHAKTSSKKKFVITFIIYIMAVHSLFFAFSRFRIPIMPLIFIYSAYGYTVLRGKLKKNEEITHSNPDSRITKPIRMH